MSSFNNKLKVVETLEISNPCQAASWESIERNKFYCSLCSKQVHDLSKLTKTQVLYLLCKNPDKICLKIIRNENNEIIFAKKSYLSSAKKKIYSVSGLLFSYLLSLFVISEKSSFAFAQSTNPQQVSPVIIDKIEDNNSEALNNLISDSPSAEVVLTPGPVGTFGEAPFENDLVRQSFGNLLMLIEGRFGTYLMISAALIGVVAYAISAPTLVLLTLALILDILILRTIISVYFAVEY